MPFISPGCVDPARWIAARQRDHTKAELLQRAREHGIEGRWTMSKSDLVAALRNH